MPEQSILSQLLCGAAALLLVGGALWALRSTGRRVEQDTRTTLDREAAQLAADWLAQLMPCSREQALRAPHVRCQQRGGALLARCKSSCPARL